VKVVVVGGTGLIGSRVVDGLAARGHDALPASPVTGVDTLTGAGLGPALAGAAVVVDVSNSPSFEDAAVLEFFETSTRNVLHAAARAGVGHHVVLSIVGADRLPDSGYMRAKVAQEALVAGAPVPSSTVRATQFFEFAVRIADEATDGATVRVPAALIQPMAADDVAAAVTAVALAAPVDGTVEVAGPEPFRFEHFVRLRLEALGDGRTVVADPGARYFGAVLDERTLVPDDGAWLAPTRFGDWLRRQARPA
jgi:uncharacterized protein YbjT (DUF2867 family)